MFLRVPSFDWINVTRGIKREFRASHKSCSALWSVEPPTPVVCYREWAGGHDSKLMVLERKWQEPLGAISEESLEAEGFATFAEFRTYWRQRERRAFPPTRLVTCYRVRPWGDDDAEMGQRLLDRLYGEFLPE